MASCAATPALSQGADALQRQVFPGGDPDFFQPEIQSGTQDGTAGNPASSPITDLTDRVNSLERQLATLTGQVEENSFELRQLRAMVEGLQGGAAIDPDVDTPILAAPADETTEPAADEAAETAPPPPETSSSEPPLPDDAGEACLSG
jgi:TolA-binding protein